MNFNLTTRLKIDLKKTQRILSRKIQKIYKSYAYFAEFFDMIWLRHQLWPVMKEQSLIFDSYNCMKHAELGVGHPWPTRCRIP